MKCTQCGAEVSSTARYCEYCGSEVMRQPEANTTYHTENTQGDTLRQNVDGDQNITIIHNHYHVHDDDDFGEYEELAFANTNDRGRYRGDSGQSKYARVKEGPGYRNGGIVVSNRSRVVAFLPCLFGGFVGAHHFYCGKVGMGLLYLFTIGFFGIGWFIDLILIAMNLYTDTNGLKLS